MPARRKHITRDMLIAAKEKGWHISLTAAHYGMHRSTISAACERFNVVLPLHPFSAQRVSPRSKVWVDMIDNGKKPKVKLSASPAAIERALRKKAEEKRLRIFG